MPERPRPDIDETRAALRRRDERVHEDPEEDSAPQPEDAEPDEEQPDPPE